MDNGRDTINHSMYFAYLSQHLLGSEGGMNAFRAAASTWKDTPVEHQLTSLARQVSDDHADLEKIIRSLGYRPHPLKQVLTHGVRWAGRLNPVNFLRKNDAAMTQVELDVLQGMLRAKKAMWTTLLLVATRDGRLDVALLQDLDQRADHQIEQVTDIIARTWEGRFFQNP